MKASEGRDISALQMSLKAVEMKYSDRLQVEYERGKARLDLLLRLLKLNRNVLDLDQATMAEIRGYPTPPVEVHRVMIAALLLLGDDETKTTVGDESTQT